MIMRLVKLFAFCIITLNTPLCFAPILVPNNPITTGRNLYNWDIDYGYKEDSWRLIDAPPGVDGIGDKARVIAPNFNWFNPEPYARWIMPPTATDGNTVFPVGTYTFEGDIMFWASGAATVKYSGRYGSDDVVTKISINGYTVFSGNGGGYDQIFPSSFGLLEANNSVEYTGHIQFTVQNTSPGPVGLVVAGQKTILWDNYSGPEKQNRPESVLGATTAKNLVLITHGWHGNINWANEMQSAIRSYINTHVADADSWDVKVCDWTEDAKGFPQTALANAVEHGYVEGNKIAELGYEKVHLIGHSAGSALIDYAARQIKRSSPDTLVQETFLDAYAPGQYPFLYGGQADWADQYLNTGDLPDTEETLKHAYNIDITALNPTLNQATDHSWPHEFYTNSIIPPPEYEGFGFPLSIEVSADWHPWTDYPAGNSITLPENVANEPPPYASFLSSRTIDFSQTLTITSQTGEVTIDGGSLLLATGSPVWTISQLNLTDPADTLSFSLTFTSEDNAEGLLAVYFDDIVVGLIDERFVLPDEPEIYQLYLGSIDPGDHTLYFRLDPYTDTPSSVRIENVFLEFTEGLSGVPEPSSVSLMIIALLAFSVLARRCKHSH